MPLTREEVNLLLLEWRDQVSPSLEAIRRAQDILLLKVGEENVVYATSLMTTMLGKGATIVSNTTNIGNAGVAVTGGHVAGDVTGTVQQSSSQLVNAREGLGKLKAALKEAPELSDEQKADALCAVEDLETEADKGQDKHNGSRVRNALGALSTAIGLAKGAEFFYKEVLPHLHDLFHLGK